MLPEEKDENFSCILCILKLFYSSLGKYEGSDKLKNFLHKIVVPVKPWYWNLTVRYSPLTQVNILKIFVGYVVITESVTV